jgi:hypothetical protein
MKINDQYVSECTLLCTHCQVYIINRNTSIVFIWAENIKNIYIQNSVQ